MSRILPSKETSNGVSKSVSRDLKSILRTNSCKNSYMHVNYNSQHKCEVTSLIRNFDAPLLGGKSTSISALCNKR